MSGAQFSELAPKDNTGILRNGFQTIPITSRGLEGATIFQITPLNSFRMGQQIMFWWGFANTVQDTDPPGDPNHITRIQFKLWWARPNLEYRTPGVPTYNGLDVQTFLNGPVPGFEPANNRYVWIPSPKRLDVTEWSSPPPPVSAVRTSDSVMLDDVITMDLQDPADATYIANFPSPQIPSRWIAFMYPAMGYALGLTYEREVDNDGSAVDPTPLLSVTYAVGTLGGTNYQESIG